MKSDSQQFVIESDGSNNLHIKVEDNCFTIIRLLCCLIIIYEHCVRVGCLSYIDMHLSELCVDIFFILSGFWVSRSYILAKNNREYIKKRVLKILPPYYMVLILTVIVFSFLCEKGMQWYWINNVGGVLRYLLFNALFLNFICPTLPGILADSSIPEINGSLWTLKIEVGFYIVLPIIIYIIKSVRRKKVILGIIYILSAVWAISMPKIGMPVSLTEQLPYYMRHFTIGMFFALNMKVAKNINILHAVAALAFIIVGLNIKMIELTIMPIAIGILLFFIGFRFKGGNITDLSYVMYLIHFPIIQILNITGIITDYMLIIAVISFSAIISLVWIVLYRILSQFIQKNKDYIVI